MQIPFRKPKNNQASFTPTFGSGLIQNRSCGRNHVPSAYMGKIAHLSRVWTHLIVILLLVNIVVLFETANMIRSSSAEYDTDIIGTACVQVSNVLNTSLNSPINALNYELARTEANIKTALERIADDVDTAADTIAALIKLVFGYYYGTYICLVHVLIESSLGVLDAGIGEVEDLANNSINAVISKVKASTGALSSGLSATTDGISNLINTISGLASSSSSATNLTDSRTINSLLSSLGNFATSDFNLTLSTNLTKKIESIENNLPSVDDLWATVLNRTIAPIRSMKPKITALQANVSLRDLKINNIPELSICSASASAMVSAVGKNGSVSAGPSVNSIAIISSKIATVFTVCAIFLLALLFLFLATLVVVESIKYRKRMRAIRNFKTQIYHYVDTHNPLNSQHPYPYQYPYTYINRNTNPYTYPKHSLKSDNLEANAHTPTPKFKNNNNECPFLDANQQQHQKKKKASRVTSVLCNPGTSTSTDIEAIPNTKVRGKSNHDHINSIKQGGQNEDKNKKTKANTDTKPKPNPILLPQNINFNCGATDPTIKTPEYRYSYASNSDEYYSYMSDESEGYTSAEFYESYGTSQSINVKNIKNCKNYYHEAIEREKMYGQRSSLSSSSNDIGEELLDLYYLSSNSILNYAKRTIKILLDLLSSKPKQSNSHNHSHNRKHNPLQTSPQYRNYISGSGRGNQIILQANGSGISNSSVGISEPARLAMLSSLLRWLVHYTYSPTLLALFFSGILLLGSTSIQILYVNRATSKYTPQIASMFTLRQNQVKNELVLGLGLVLGSGLELGQNSTWEFNTTDSAVSMQAYFATANNKIAALESSINTSLAAISSTPSSNSSSSSSLGLAALNNTLNDIVTAYTGILTRSLNNTLFLTPVLGYLNCTIGKQIANAQFLLNLVSRNLILSNLNFTIPRLKPSNFLFSFNTSIDIDIDFSIGSMVPDVTSDLRAPVDNLLAGSLDALRTLIIGKNVTQYIEQKQLMQQLQQPRKTKADDTASYTDAGTSILYQDQNQNSKSQNGDRHGDGDEDEKSRRFGGYSGGLVKILANTAIHHLENNRKAAIVLIVPWAVLVILGLLRISLFYKLRL